MGAGMIRHVLPLAAIAMATFLHGIVLPVRAAEVTSVIATCDAASGRAEIIFGLIQVDDSTGLPSHGREASCALPDGREVKARYGAGATAIYDKPTGLPAVRFSVWVNKIKIIHAADGKRLPHGILVEQDGFRRCYPLKDRRARNGVRMESTDGAVVLCDAKLSPISGPIDLVEYPPPGSAPGPRVGSVVVVSSANDHLCRALIVRYSEFPNLEEGDVVAGFGPDDEMVSARRLDRERLEWKSTGDEGTWTVIDMRNSGRLDRVYREPASEYSPGDEFLAIPDDTLREWMRNGLSREPIWPQEIVEDMGGTWFGGDETPYKRGWHVSQSILRVAGATYLLAHSTDGADPSAILLKPKPDGGSEIVCIFQAVRPNF
jgi:hypothetical protein